MPLRVTLGLGTLVCLLGTFSCGARSELRVPPPLPPEPECNRDSDCPSSSDLCQPVRCVDPDYYPGELPELPAGVPMPPRVCVVVDAVDCDDSDPCTEDRCEPATGECAHGPATFDLDGDGHRAPRPGTIAGEPGSCGDDCNDASAAAYPGNTEICDGVDNDCNGIVDDGADFVPLEDGPVRISGNIAPAAPGGLGFDGETYLSVYTGTSDGFDMYETRIDELGNKIEPIEQQIAVQNADSSGGPVVWVGDRYGLAWQDRRDGDYEVYFTLLDHEGKKAIADTRLTNALGFSINVSLTYNGTEFVAVWQDERNGMFEVMAQRIDIDGVPIGGNVTLSQSGGFADEAPVVASGSETIGVAYANGQAGLQVIRFQTFEQTTLAPHSSLVTLTDQEVEAVYPVIAYNGDGFVVAWYVRTGDNRAIFATTIDEDGQVLVPPTAVSQPGAFRSRYPSLLPLGDRLLVVYADDRDGNSGYELYTRMVSSALVPLTEERRLTNAPYDSIYPVATFGNDGLVGILFRDDRENGDHHVWFTRLGCVTPLP
jgi:hypothetical protein